MALINCPECKASVSDIAESCPQCGNPIKGKRSQSISGVDAFIVLGSLVVSGFLIFKWVFEQVHSHRLNALGQEIRYDQTTTAICIRLAIALIPVLLALIWSGRSRR